MSLEPITIEKTKVIAKNFGLTPVRIRGTTQVQICKTMNPDKYQIISWDEFQLALEEKDLCVGKDRCSNFLKIIKKPN